MATASQQCFLMRDPFRLPFGCLCASIKTNVEPIVKERTAAIPWRKSRGQIYEYACHEGNYAMIGILNGGREEDKAAQEAAKKKH